MLAVILVSIGMVALGLYLVAVETNLQVRTGERRPFLRNIGQLLALIGALCVLGAIVG